MDTIIPTTTYDDLNLDVSFAESGLEVVGADSEECTSDNCGYTPCEEF